MNNRNLDYEKKFRAYLFKGDIGRFKRICEDNNIVHTLKSYDEVVKWGLLF